MKVLVIDADPVARKFLMASIEALGGYEVQLAKDGTQGLEVAHAWRPDCVLVDLLVPGIDGFTLIARLRHGAASPRTGRIVVSSGIMDSGMLPHLIKLGVDAVLPRPFMMSDLEKALGLEAPPEARGLVADLN
ncbi:MAG: response regulator [Chloroflexi bacterium]|nr:response regulator [Chloroflexota bacterium]